MRCNIFFVWFLLEFKEAVTRYGTDIKQKIMDSFRSTWNTISEFAHTRRAYAKSNTMDDEVQSEVTHMLSHMAQQPPDDDAACEFVLNIYSNLVYSCWNIE